MASRERAGLRILLVPEDGRQPVTLRVTPRRLWLGLVGLLAVVGTVAALAGSWWYMAARAAQVPELQAEVAQLSTNQEQVASLAAQLAQMEERYDQIRSLFGIDSLQLFSDLWVPPASAPRSPGPEDGSEAGIPSSWPLTESGFVTQSLLDEEVGDHPGLDIAVPSQSYIRAAGSGRVEETGDDPIYGMFVTIAHQEGYLTLYAHASDVFVVPGQRVRRNEVIALTGSTGRSTAPHLHFEVRRNGETVDPLSLIEPSN